MDPCAKRSDSVGGVRWIKRAESLARSIVGRFAAKVETVDGYMLEGRRAGKNLTATVRDPVSYVLLAGEGTVGRHVTEEEASAAGAAVGDPVPTGVTVNASVCSVRRDQLHATYSTQPPEQPAMPRVLLGLATLWLGEYENNADAASRGWTHPGVFGATGFSISNNTAVYGYGPLLPLYDSPPPRGSYTYYGQVPPVYFKTPSHTRPAWFQFTAVRQGKSNVIGVYPPLEPPVTHINELVDKDNWHRVPDGLQLNVTSDWIEQHLPAGLRVMEFFPAELFADPGLASTVLTGRGRPPMGESWWGPAPWAVGDIVAEPERGDFTWRLCFQWTSEQLELADKNPPKGLGTMTVRTYLDWEAVQVTGEPPPVLHEVVGAAAIYDPRDSALPGRPPFEYTEEWFPNSPSRWGTHDFHWFFQAIKAVDGVMLVVHRTQWYEEIATYPFLRQMSGRFLVILDSSGNFVEVTDVDDVYPAATGPIVTELQLFCGGDRVDETVYFVNPFYRGELLLVAEDGAVTTLPGNGAWVPPLTTTAIPSPDGPFGPELTKPADRYSGLAARGIASAFGAGYIGFMVGKTSPATATYFAVVNVRTQVVEERGLMWDVPIDEQKGGVGRIYVVQDEGDPDPDTGEPGEPAVLLAGYHNGVSVRTGVPSNDLEELPNGATYISYDSGFTWELLFPNHGPTSGIALLGNGLYTPQEGRLWRS